MNNLKRGFILPIELSLRYPTNQIPSTNSDVLKSFQRNLCSSVVLKTKRGAGGEEGKLSSDEINKMVENEKRGIFRQLDIGLPRPWVKDMKRFDDRIVVKAAPR